MLLMIVGSAGVAVWESLQKLLEPTSVDHLGWVALAGVLGFFGNEAVAQYRIRVGQRIGSAALVADGYHARTDRLTSLAVVLGALGVSLDPGLVGRAESAAAGADGVESVSAVRPRWIGHALRDHHAEVAHHHARSLSV